MNEVRIAAARWYRERRNIIDRPTAGRGRLPAPWMSGVTAGAAILLVGGCVNVNAPSEAIVIELNINIKQEVLYRLVDSAQQNIEDNPEIF